MEENTQIYYNGTILTMEESQPTAEAIRVKNGIIDLVGSQKEVFEKKQTNTECIDLDGKTLMPGFIDPHSHLSAFAIQLLLVNLRPSPSGICDSIEDLISECKKALQKRNPEDKNWLLGIGYDNSVFQDEKHPTKFDLDQISTEIPIGVVHVSGHCAVLNSKGLELAGYTGNYSVPEGGAVITIPGTNEPNGLLQEAAFFQVSSKCQNAMLSSMEKITQAVKKAASIYASFGITTGQDARTGKSEYGLLLKAAEEGFIPIDIVSYVEPSVADELLPKGKVNGEYKKHYRIAGYKYFLDGSPQGKTAWLSKPYYIVPEGQKPDYNGFPTEKEEDVLDTMRKCIHNHWQINVHTNGDNAIEQFIRCYKTALEEYKIQEQLKETPDFRPVSIHCQTVREDQLDRMKEIGMIPSYFLDHVYYWGDYHYESVLGPERAQRISPLRSTIKRGISFTMHQDTPVVMPNVLFAVHNAVNRKTRKGRILGEEQKITVDEALKAVTINGAYQIFEEKRKGSIRKGKLADFVILSENPLRVQKEQIKDIKIYCTIKEGTVIYQNPEWH